MAACLMMSPSALAQDDQGEIAGDGAGIVEMANPAGDPCEADNPGCAEYGGATVWKEPNPQFQYYVSAAGGDLGISRLERYRDAAAPFTFEMRFTDECANADGSSTGNCIAVNAFTTDSMTAVPFELWNIGDVDPGVDNDPSDDLRMIPFLNPNASEGADWANRYTGTQAGPFSDETPITDWVYWMMPQSQDAHSQFIAAAQAAGGAGNVYPWADVDGDGMTDDGDTYLNLSYYQDPDTLCSLQGYYVSACYRNGEEFIDNASPGANNFSEFVYPIGRFVLADVSGTGETPKPGTVIRVYTTGSAAEETGNACTAQDLATGLCPGFPGNVVGGGTSVENGATASGFGLTALYPNPSRDAVTVEYALERAGHVRIALYDVLGREVAVVLDESRAAGADRVTVQGNNLPAGVYFVRAVMDGVSSLQRVSFIR